MKKFYLLFGFLPLLAALPPEAQAHTQMDFGPNGNGGTCSCWSLQDGLTPQAGTTPSFIAVSTCRTGSGSIGSTVLNEYLPGSPMTFNFPNSVASLPAPPTGFRRVFVCGNPPGTTPLINYNTSTVYASYADVPCANGFSVVAVPLAQQPPWFSQFQSGNGANFPVCNP